MSRPLRIEYPGACYHVTTRGNGDQAIFTCAEDGARFLDLFGREAAQQRWICCGWCLMETHYHLLVETPSQSRRTHKVASTFLFSITVSNIDFFRFPGPVVDWISGNSFTSSLSRIEVALASARSMMGCLGPAISGLLLK